MFLFLLWLNVNLYWIKDLSMSFKIIIFIEGKMSLVNIIWEI